jgi:hypothetical protein
LLRRSYPCVKTGTSCPKCSSLLDDVSLRGHPDWSSSTVLPSDRPTTGQRHRPARVVQALRARVTGGCTLHLGTLDSDFGPRTADSDLGFRNRTSDSDLGPRTSDSQGSDNPVGVAHPGAPPNAPNFNGLLASHAGMSRASVGGGAMRGADASEADDEHHPLEPRRRRCLRRGVRRADGRGRRPRTRLGQRQHDGQWKRIRIVGGRIEHRNIDRERYLMRGSAPALSLVQRHHLRRVHIEFVAVPFPPSLLPRTARHGSARRRAARFRRGR